MVCISFNHASKFSLSRNYFFGHLLSKLTQLFYTQLAIDWKYEIILLFNISYPLYFGFAYTVYFFEV